MRNFYAVFALIISAFSAQGQNIPDANFATAIRQQCPACIDANNNLLPAAATRTILNVNFRQISDLTGIGGFTSLQTLNCNGNQLTSLPTLPSSLTSLNCASNQLTSLSALPAGLANLYCNNNQLTSLPTLPAGLANLYCNNNQLTSLPTLPAGLTTLRCGNNPLTVISSLPNNLIMLECNRNQLTNLPTLPNSLVDLNCSSNQLTNLPALPASLNTLICYANQLTNLPTLPNSLVDLNCFLNQITSLPTLPSNLFRLDCDKNQLTSLPALPDSLIYLYCSNNQLTSLPSLPPNLIIFVCDSNAQLSCLPVLPNQLDNSTLGGVFEGLGTNITCIPNLPPNLITTLPICTPSNNPNGCLLLSQAQGRVYFDLNTNSSFDGGDVPAAGQLLITTNNLFAAATDNNGFYSLALDINTTNTISLPVFYNTNYFTISPASHTVTTNTAIQNYPSNDFILTPLGSFDDLEVQTFGGLYRPGFDNTFYISYRNVGTTAINGSLSLDLDTDVSFISSSVPSTQVGQNLSFNFSNLAPFETRTIEILVNVDTSVSLGTAINHTLNGILNNDADITNNQYVSNDIVVGSYDPNDINANKEEICSNYPTELEEDLVYTIRFQNTGTFYAQNVRVEDTLSALLDISSFQQMAASHNYRLVFDNVFINGEYKILAKWYFDNIMLLDSFTNEPLSHGYIKYKIKPLAAQLANRNEIIASQAHIYFDFNAAINTNIDEVVSNICMGINENAADNSSQSFQILPNPNKGNFSLRFAENIDLENANLYIYNCLGELVTQQKLQNTNQSITTNNLPAATYIVKVQAENTTFVQKMIVE